MPALRGGSLAAVLVLLAGCAPADPARALLEDYRARVLRVLEMDAAPLRVVDPAPWPRARARTHEIPAQRVNLIEFLGLHECDLGALVGERSSPLGRVMAPSQRLRYELRFLGIADACVPEEAADREALAEFVAAKRAALPFVLWNATLGDAALAAHLALDVAPLEPGRAAGAGRNATGALLRLAARAEAPEASATDDDWEAPWRTLERDRYGGRARQSLALLTAALDDVAAALERREATQPLCPLGRPTPEARILETVFTRYYAGAVQPYLAEVEPGWRRWLQALDALRAAQSAPAPEGFAAAVAGLLPFTAGTDRRAFVAARSRHTKAWQDVLGACGLGPRRPASGAEDRAAGAG